MTHPIRFDVAAAARVARFFDDETDGYLDDLPALRAFARRTGGPLLELGCGSGRLVEPLARAGFEITGVDLSPAMLDLARTRIEASGTGKHVRLIQGDYTQSSLGGPYRLAFIVMNTFLHLLSKTEQVQALRHWRAHLAPGALLVIDVFAPDVNELAGFAAHLEYDKSWRDSATGALVTKHVSRTLDQARQIVHLTMFYDEVRAGGALYRTAVEFDLRYVWRAEAELLLEQAGFELAEVYGDWDLSPFDSGSERLILVAQQL